MATLARMHVELIADGSRFEREMKKARTTTQKLRDALTKSRSAMGLMAGAAGFGFAAKAAFDLGAAVEETASKFSTVFGQSTQEVNTFIERFGTVAGLSKQQSQAVLSTTGSIVQGMGFAQQASARFSTAAVQLAGDLSSFNNVPIEETSMAINAALTGEREQLKRLGIVIRETDVQQRALVESGKSSVKALTNQEKAAATLALITERAGVAVGDLARTQDSAANKGRALNAMLVDIRDTMASTLLPVLSFAVEGFMRFIKGIQIMAAEAAVLVAQMNFWKEAAFGTMESTMAANDQLRAMRVAAEEVKGEIIGLTFNMDGLSTATAGVGGGGGGGVANAFRVADVSVREFASKLPGVTTGVTLFASAQYALGNATDAANAALEKQSSLQSQLGAVTGALGFLSGFGPLSFLAGPLGKLTGGIGSFFGLKGAFPGMADGGPVAGGRAYMVGERGPEMFVPSSSGTIVPSGGITINVPAARDPITFARDQQWMRAIAETWRELESNGFRAAT